MFSLRKPMPLLIVILLHIAFFWALQSGLRHRPAQQLHFNEVLVSLIQSVRVAPPQPKVEPPKPKPIVRQLPKPEPVVIPRETPPPVVEEELVTVPTDAPPTLPTHPVAPREPVQQEAKPEPVPISTPRFDAAYLNNPAPAYPALSRRMGEEGKVMLRVLVGADGAANEVRLHNSSGSTRLDEAAMQAVRSWRFVPAKQGDKAVPAWVVVPISFRLDA